MKTMILTGAMLAVLAGAAFAQSGPVTPPAPAPAMDGAGKAAPPAPPPGPGAGIADDAGPGAPPPPPGAHGRRPPPPPPSRAAHFALQRGDAALDVKCADDEPMKSCADIALQMLDRLGTPAKP